MTNRLDEIEASRRPSPPRQTTQADADLKWLAAQPAFQRTMNHYKALLWRETVVADAPNVSALLLIEGRRSFHRDIERDVERASRDRPDPGPRPE